MTVSRFFKAVCIASMLSVLAACDSYDSGVAAPLGDKATLEKLAKAYRTVEENQQLDSSPLTLVPEKRKKFIGMVFAESGYSYSATLHSLAQSLAGNKLNVIDQNTKDLAELLLMPHRGATSAMEDIYSAQELQDVRTIESKL